MPIKKTLVSETSDGQFFPDETDAQAHEYKLQKEQLIKLFLEHGAGSSYTDRGKASASRIIGDFCDMLSENEMALPWGSHGVVDSNPD